MTRLYRLLCLALFLSPFAVIAYEKRQEQRAAESWAMKVQECNREIERIRAHNRKIAEEMRKEARR
jgi:hypothetical protein